MFRVKSLQEKENFALVAIEPLEAGLGHTLGNSLRRVLLMNLEGAAVTSVKIDGVAHQFSTIDGVSEDVVEIIMNLKKVRFKIDGDQPIKVSLKVAGKKGVKAVDFEVQGPGEVVNKDLHIAHLNDAKAKLNIEMVVERGKGFSVAEERNSSEIGVIPTDALFSPVTSVNYRVEPTRVGRKANFDRLLLEVTTDGSTSPMEALEQASKLLSGLFKQVYEPSEVEELESAVGVAPSDEVLKMSVEELDLPVRITNALKAIDIETVEQLVNEPRGQLLKAKNLGNKSLSLISEKLSERGLTLQ